MKKHIRNEHKKVFIDTNILIYATLQGDKRFKTANSLLLNKDNNYSELYISVQNLAEMYPNLTGPQAVPPNPPSLAGRKILSISDLPHLQILPLTFSIQKRALILCEKYSVIRQKYFDMQIVAAMLENDISLLLTENIDDFRHIEEINVLNPFEDL